MADTYTQNLRITKPEVNANEDTWGDDLNNEVITMLEEAIVGTASVSLTGGNVVLGTANGVTDQHRPSRLFLTGTPGTTRSVTFPDVKKMTWVLNQSDSPATLTAGVGTTVTVQSGERVLAFTDGATNVAAMASDLQRRKAMSPVTLTDGATVSVDAAKSCIFDLTMGGNRTLGNPSNAVSGQPLLFRVKASGADRTLSLDTKYRFGTDIAALTATTSAKTDFVGVVYNSTDDKFDVVSYLKGY